MTQTWCYQAVNHAVEEDRVLLHIHEIHYNNANEIIFVSEDPVHAFGVDMEKLQEDLSLMKTQIAQRPILRLAEVKDKINGIVLINKR